jgi:hypothetical protein
MGKALSILLLGVLSMLFAEVFSGASTLWFLSAWGLLLTLPLYLGHALFFFNVAVRTNRTSLRQLYFFGIMFGLYEALITKVLFTGYPGSTGPIFGYFFGVAWGEFLTLVLFWHPVMSFVLPVLVYELLSGDVIAGHDRFLQKNWKTIVVALLVVVIGAGGQSNGAKLNVLVALGSLGGTIFIIYVLHRLTPKKNLASLTLGNKGLAAVTLYLVALYGLLTVWLVPGKLPTTVVPYLIVFLWYLVAIGLLWIDRSPTRKLPGPRDFFSSQDLGILAVLLLVLSTVFSLMASASTLILLIFFIPLNGVGVLLFLFSLLTLIRQRVQPVPS